MTENREDPAMIDRMLETMAQETPEMPADFHARWTEQIRAEAAKAREDTRQESRRQWRYILSAAAVFVFLIGGTLLTRNQKKNEKVNSVPMVQDSIVENAAGGSAPGAAPEPGEAAEGEADGGMPMMAFEDMAVPVTEGEEMGNGTDSAVLMEESETLYAAYEEDGEEPDSAAYDAEAMEAPDLAAEAPAVNMAAESAKAVSFAAGSARESAEAPEELPTSAPTASPTAAATACPTATPAATPAEEENGFVSFLKDLGIFTLKTLAVAAAAAALAFLGAVICRGLKKRKNGKKGAAE